MYTNIKPRAFNVGYTFHPKEVFKVAEINCLAELLDYLCYEESSHMYTYIYVYAHTHIYVAEFILPSKHIRNIPV